MKFNVSEHLKGMGKGDGVFYASLIFACFCILLAAGYNLETIVHFLRPLVLLIFG